MRDESFYARLSPPASHPSQGFSLVELSIVLVILGLLTGGILTGQNLIRAAELRSVVAEFQGFQTAIHTFRDKYFALPGDMTNATRFWGEAHADPATCETTVSTGTETCNGDGDGKIVGSAPNYNERERFWQHLANAGMIEGQYIGVNATLVGYTDWWVPGINVPASKLSNALWMIGWVPENVGSTTNFAYPAGNTLRITSFSSTTMTPEECWNVDKKLDDGLPGSGKMRAFKGNATFPVTTAAGIAPPGDTGATYDFSVTDKVCNPWMYF